jgi:hypothetical protein
LGASVALKRPKTIKESIGWLKARLVQQSDDLENRPTKLSQSRQPAYDW